MAASPDAEKEVITFQGAKAVVWPRGDCRWAVSWSQGGRGKSSTFKRRVDAVAKGKAVVREIASGLGTRAVSIEEAEILTVLRRVCGERSPVAVLHELEDAMKAMRGLPLRKAVEHWRATGMSDVERMPVLKGVNAFLDDCEKRKGLATLSRAGLRKELQAFGREHDGLAVCEIDQALLASWIDRGTPAARFRNNRLATWKTFLNWARKQGWWPKAEKHPGEVIERRQEPKRMPPIWTVDEVSAALKALRPQLRCYVALGCFAGLRPFEITRLQWEDFDWEREYIHVRAEVAGKTLVARYVPIEANLAAILSEIRQATGAVAIHHSREYASIDLRKAGVITSWPQDVMRHSYISYRIARGDGAGLVAEHSGNSERIIRKHYRQPLRKEDGLAWFAVGI